MKNTILFDMDGVIVDTEPLAIKRSIKALESYGFNYDLDILKSCIGTSFARTFEILAEMINQPLPEDYEETENSFYPPHLVDYKTIKLNNLDLLLDYLKINNYKTAICSSSPIERIHIILESLGLSDYFDVILSGEQFTHNKPHPEVYLNAMKQLNADPSECIIIEDSEIGLQAGNEAGATTIALLNDFYEIDSSIADFIINDFKEVLDMLDK